MIGLVVLIVAIVSVVSAVLAGLCLLAIDSMIHGTLYHYGLQFSAEWANTYWLISRIAFSLLVVVALASIGLYIFSRSAVKTWNDLIRIASARSMNPKEKKHESLSTSDEEEEESNPPTTQQFKKSLQKSRNTKKDRPH